MPWKGVTVVRIGLMSNYVRKSIYLALALGISWGWAGPLARGGESGPAENKSFLRASDEDVQQWRRLKFGLFVHWGPVSLKGTEIGWSRGGERRGTGGTGEIPVEVYDNLYKEFNPVEFDAGQWVQLAKDAGMRYLVFTSKHHDGFSMFESRLTDYKVMNSPFGRDVVKELADACHAGGLKLGYYYSPVDWHHPDYRTANHQRYVEYLHGQLREICSNYGRIDIVWFDGLGGSAKDWDAENLFQTIRQLQPHVIINDRAGLRADHDTPEQTIGSFQRDRPWETCMTICQQWAWKPNDHMKSLKECLQTLVRVVGGDGNLLFNVGPMPDGRIEPRQVDRLREMGDWLRKYGESIYGTRGGPFKTTGGLASTYRDNTIYVHILDWPGDTITLPALPKRVTDASLLTGGSVSVRQTQDTLEIQVPAGSRQEIDTIVKLELDGPAAAIDPLVVGSTSIASGKKATASNVFQNSRDHGPAKAFDDDPGTRWATDAGVKQAWLEVDLGKPTTFARVSLSEAFDRVQRFELQYKEGETWKPFLQGTRLGDKYAQTFDPLTAQHVRLTILEATDGPTIWEFHLLPPGKAR